MKRNHNYHQLKKNYSHSIAEICKSLSVHKNTVHNWIKDEGLKTIDNSKPFLVHGSDLKEFLQKRQDAQKLQRKDDEIYCVKCHQHRKPFGNLVDVFMITKTRGNLQGLCPVCDGKIYKGFGVQKLDLIKKTFDVGVVHDLHLRESFNSSSNCDFN